MWVYAVALADKKESAYSNPEDIWKKTINDLEVKIVYTDFNNPKEALVRAVSQKLYKGDKHLDARGMAEWTHEDLKETSLDELIAYYRYSSMGLFISTPVLVQC